MIPADPKQLKKLENANIRSYDLESGDAVNKYLDGLMSLLELQKVLTRRRREAMTIIKGIDKLLNISVTCPNEVSGGSYG